ncbi:hypothetical protein DSUL_20144 [Desulfovibrionales bacterium]
MDDIIEEASLDLFFFKAVQT